MGEKYIGIVLLDEPSALREQWPFNNACENCTAWPCLTDCEINKFPPSHSEAMETMAKAMYAQEFGPDGAKEWDSLDVQTQCDWLGKAQAGLDALLEMGK